MDINQRGILALVIVTVLAILFTLAYERWKRVEPKCLVGDGFRGENGLIYCSGRLIPVAFVETPKKLYAHLCEMHLKVVGEAFREVR